MPVTVLALVVLGLACTAVAIAATALAARLAVRVGLVDQPGPLKVHQRPVPYLGGLGVAAALVLGVAGGRPLLGLPLALALGLGVADDARGLPPWARLAGEVAIGVVVAVLVPTRLPSILGFVGVIAVVVLVINGLNMVDGLDGLAGGVGAVSAIGFALVLVGPGRVLAVALAGGLIGFLVWNRPPARVYLGDGGSYLVGASLAVLVILAWGPRATWSHSLGALALVAYPVAELAFAVVRRLRARVPLTSGDRGHVYDRLVLAGSSAPAASAACVGLQAGLVLLGLLASQLSGVAALALVAGAAGALGGTALAIGLMAAR
jgi:UDP-GlcNAc:undecaprenyl-phosphate GlcNAc-1-phosphate transferase